MTRIGHVMILASAGSGKTYALTNRFVRLLALGAQPERIVALTFTRKAAGEFFDEILKKLAHAARDPASARRLAAEIGAPALGAPGFF
jgi:ATP-dependent exoDNAse (exonuclease V) beta subunit